MSQRYSTELYYRVCCSVGQTIGTSETGHVHGQSGLRRSHGLYDSRSLSYDLHPLHLLRTAGVYFNQRQWALLVQQTRFQICCSYSFQQENRSGQARKGHCHASCTWPTYAQHGERWAWYVYCNMDPQIESKWQTVLHLWVHTNLLVSDETWTPPMLWWTEDGSYNHTITQKDWKCVSLILHVLLMNDDETYSNYWSNMM